MGWGRAGEPLEKLSPAPCTHKLSALCWGRPHLLGAPCPATTPQRQGRSSWESRLLPSWRMQGCTHRPHQPPTISLPPRACSGSGDSFKQSPSGLTENRGQGYGLDTRMPAPGAPYHHTLEPWQPPRPALLVEPFRCHVARAHGQSYSHHQGHTRGSLFRACLSLPSCSPHCLTSRSPLLPGDCRGRTWGLKCGYFGSPMGSGRSD